MTPVQIEGVAEATIQVAAPIALKFLATNPQVQIGLVAFEGALIAIENAQAAGVFTPDEKVLMVEKAINNILGLHNTAVVAAASALAAEPTPAA